MQVTISLLPVSLSLVHIPRSRLVQLSHPILRQILQPNPTFLNITSNEIELSLFADGTILEDFEPIARRDRHRAESKRKGASANRDIEPVEISTAKWSVIQIDSHGDQIDNSGARVNEVSALLAAAGISILYQSSYMSDFIFVKEARLQEAMDLFASAGFDLYSSGFDPSISQPISLTAYVPRVGNRSSIHDFRIGDSTPIPGAVLTRLRSATDPYLRPTTRADETKASENGTTLVPLQNSTRSPTSGNILLLPSDLTCMGLSDELGVDHWGLKIVKLVAFPDLIASSSPSYHSSKVPTPLFDFSPPTISPSVHGDFSDSSSSSTSGDDYFPQSPSPSTKSSCSSASKSGGPSSEVKEPAMLSSPEIPELQIESLIPSAIHKSHTTHSTPESSGSKVPFFSYTKTPEGCSLTADVYILATLFPPHERHMVICSGELDAADDRMASWTDPSEVNYGNSTAEDFTDSSGSILRCLQIDLQRFGLDKHGLVSRFSQVLEANGINHMYSSTYKTANVLVDKKHALRAQALLRAC